MEVEIKDIIEWAIQKLADYPDTKTAREILRRELTRYELAMHILHGGHTN